MVTFKDFLIEQLSDGAVDNLVNKYHKVIAPHLANDDTVPNDEIKSKQS